MPKEKLEDISNKIFINYQNRLKNFERLFYIILGLSLFFLFFLLIPESFIHNEQFDIEKNNTNFKRFLFPSSISNDASINAQQEYLKFINELLHAVKNLKNFTDTIINSGSNANPEIMTPCDRNLRIDYNITDSALCKIIAKVNTLFNGYNFNSTKYIGPLFSMYADGSQIKYTHETLLKKPIRPFFSFRLIFILSSCYSR